MRKVKIFNKEELENEKLSWIEKHGSHRLQLLEKTGCFYYSCYVAERIQKEFPSGVYNLDRKVIYFELNPNPSDEILEKTSELMDSNPYTLFHIYKGALISDLTVKTNDTVLTDPEDAKKLKAFIGAYPHYADQMVALLDWEHVV